MIFGFSKGVVQAYMNDRHRWLELKAANNSIMSKEDNKELKSFRVDVKTILSALEELDETVVRIIDLGGDPTNVLTSRNSFAKELGMAPISLNMISRDISRVEK